MMIRYSLLPLYPNTGVACAFLGTERRVHVHSRHDVYGRHRTPAAPRVGHGTVASQTNPMLYMRSWIWGK